MLKKPLQNNTNRNTLILINFLSENWSQGGPQEASWRVLGASWAALWRFLGASWALLGASWAPWGSQKVPKTAREVIFAGLGYQNGAKFDPNRAQIDAKSIQTLLYFQSLSRYAFLSTRENPPSGPTDSSKL